MNYEPPTVEVLAPVMVFLSPFPVETTKPNEQIDLRIIKIKQFIEDKRGAAGSDLDKICKQLSLHISGAYAAQLFNESLGMGWREYAARYRLATAAERLKTTFNSIKEIALELGYRRPQDLSRGFKKTYGLTPTDYRHLFHLLELMWPVQERPPETHLQE
jgi:two-component system response regulator YesN